MQFWFNTSSVNETEDIIEAYFHIYKRRAIRPPNVPAGSHRVTVSDSYATRTSIDNLELGHELS